MQKNIFNVMFYTKKKLMSNNMNKNTPSMIVAHNYLVLSSNFCSERYK